MLKIKNRVNHTKYTVLIKENTKYDVLLTLVSKISKIKILKLKPFWLKLGILQFTKFYD